MIKARMTNPAFLYLTLRNFQHTLLKCFHSAAQVCKGAPVPLSAEVHEFSYVLSKAEHTP